MFKRFMFESKKVTLFTKLFFSQHRIATEKTQEPHGPTGLSTENPHRNANLKML